MKILMVTRSLPCHVAGGLEHHVVDLARGLSGRGHEVHLLSTLMPDDYKSVLIASGIAPHELPGVAPGRYSRRWFSGIGPRIRELHAAHPCDIIHGHEFAFGFDPPSRAECGAGVVLSVHGTITSETPLHRDVWPHLSPFGKARALARFGRRFLFAPAWKRAMTRADALAVDSEFTRAELARLFPRVVSKVGVVPLAPPEAAFEPMDRNEAREALGWDAGGRLFITLGRLEWQKGHDIALDALARIKDRPWKYVIAGEGRERTALERLASRLGIADRVIFTGRLDGEAKARALAAADLFIWPERTHPAFGLVGVESMLMGLPVLAVRRGAIPEVIDEDSGWIIPPGDPAALAAALTQILDHPDGIESRRNELRERALVRFTMDKMVDGMLAVYRAAD